MRQMLEGVGFSQRAHFECTEQALEVVLRHSGYELEAVLFDQWEFLYQSSSTSPMAFAVTPGGPVNKTDKFLAAGMTLRFRRGHTPEEALDGVRERVRSGQPTPVWVDPYYLPYYAGSQPRHTDHAVVVDGYDEEQDTVHIVDPSPWQQFKGDLPATTLMAAISSEHHAAKGESNSWIEIELPVNGLTGRSRRILATIARNVVSMLEGTAHSECDGQFRVERHTGQPGLRAFAEVVQDWRGLDFETMAACMLRCREPFMDIGRRLYGHACYLAWAANATPIDELAPMATEVTALAEQWFLPANLMFKGSRREPLKMLPRAHARLVEVIDQQERALHMLQKLVR